MKKILGFTLAEVLITLGIIGVVAAITIPTLINITNKTEYVTALKKSYSVLSQAHEQIIVDDDELKFALSGANTSQDFANVFIPKMKVAQDCGLAAIPGECFSEGKFLNSNPFDFPTFLASLGASDASSFVTSDGMSYVFILMSSTCDVDIATAWYSFSEASPLHQVCGAIVTDVNGQKKGPSKAGRDIFVFWAAQKGIYPWGMLAPEIETECSLTGNGGYCASKVLSEGVMNY